MATLSNEQAKEIVGELAGTEAYKTWEETGNVAIEDSFSWPWKWIHTDTESESGIGQLIDEEFEMYQHHLGMKSDSCSRKR